ncbi:hypothetical protein [Robertmurraya andreesenii]|uniref:TIGR04255 family protein n=1 Tax=Anoxybacillus andreesenii TaxID=1325932 RepID=A0ABT9UZX2_9BACL|nr:hypothetical protein [Robertmurraya andreesenii]MDQ0154231.1 hypothetical protein [Robertmurraya andreesenii]
MLIKNTRFNIVYPRISNLRRKAFDIEDLLKDYFHQVTLIPVPDDAPEEIPRISTTSHNGHSQLNISLSNTQLITNYDDTFQGKWENCLTYVEDRVNTLYNVLGNYANEGYFFSGLTTEIVFETLTDKEPIKDPINLIKSKFINIDTNTNPHDIEQKITFVIEEEYYVNITFKNLRVYEGLNIQSPGMLRNEKAHYLVCVLDINDRYGFNYKDAYTSNIENAMKVINITRSILDNKLHKMILEGVFDL